jgi:hypothetical protein
MNFGQSPGGMGDPLNAQGYRTQRAESPEDLWQPLYDRVNYPNAGATQLAFFAIPQGGSATLILGVAAAAAITKGFRDTNMQNANVVPTKMFKFLGISLGFVHQIPGTVGVGISGTPSASSDAADRDRIRNSGYLEFTIVDKKILDLPLIAFPEVNPWVVASTTQTNVSILGTAGGGGSNVPMYKLPIPITLNPYENFAVTLNFPAAVALSQSTNSIDIYIILQGFMRRPT